MSMLYWAIDAYRIVLLAAVLVSWVRVDPGNPAVRALHALTEPLLGPIRKVLPTGLGLDFSPLVLLFLLSLLRGML